MRIVELTGQPCAGKSSFARASKALTGVVLFNRHWLFETFKIPVKSQIFGRFVYELLMMYGGVRNIKFSVLLNYFVACCKVRGSLYRKINIFRNILHKYAVHEFAKRIEDDRILLVDEGLSHIPYIFSDCLDSLDSKLFLECLEKRPWVLNINSSNADIKYRIKSRGHKRAGKTSHSINSFYEDNQKCSKLQNKLMKDYRYFMSVDLPEAGIEAKAQETFRKIRLQIL